MITSITTKTALSFLAKLIKTARQHVGMSQIDLAVRLGVSRQTVIAIEKASPQVSVGIVFEAAHIVGVPLLSDSQDSLNQWQTVLSGFNALLPQRIHTKQVDIDDDF